MTPPQAPPHDGPTYVSPLEAPQQPPLYVNEVDPVGAPFTIGGARGTDGARVVRSMGSLVAVVSAQPSCKARNKKGGE